MEIMELHQLVSLCSNETDGSYSSPITTTFKTFLSYKDISIGMPEDTFSYKILMDAVFAATDITRGSVYPDDSNYVAISLDTVKSIVASFDSKPCSSAAENSHDQARRLWYRFKEHHPRCACGIVRLMSPVPNDLVGIVTAEDLLEMNIKTSSSASCLDREMLNDDLSEIPGVSVPCPHQSLPVKPIAERPTRLKPPWRPKEAPDLSPKAEMTLIEPQTREIFKRSQGGAFGEGKWQVSEIRAFAVWF
jgi:hypothetical protein